MRGSRRLLPIALLIGSAIVTWLLAVLLCSIAVFRLTRPRVQPSLSLAPPPLSLSAGSPSGSGATQLPQIELPSNSSQTGRVIEVVDGDTIYVLMDSDGAVYPVRYIGIDTPETVHPELSPQCFGAEATKRNRELVDGKFVELWRGAENEDQYGRLLRYVFVDDIFVNAELIAEGYARQYAFGPERRFQQVFVELEQYAISKNRGMWGSCPN